jgi:hypothetical protein
MSLFNSLLSKRNSRISSEIKLSASVTRRLQSIDFSFAHFSPLMSEETVQLICQSATIMSISHCSGWDVLMGSLCITLLLLMREMRWPDWKAKNGRQIPPKWWPVIKEIIRLMNVCKFILRKQ